MPDVRQWLVRSILIATAAVALAATSALLCTRLFFDQRVYEISVLFGAYYGHRRLDLPNATYTDFWRDATAVQATVRAVAYPVRWWNARMRREPLPDAALQRAVDATLLQAKALPSAIDTFGGSVFATAGGISVILYLTGGTWHYRWNDATMTLSAPSVHR